MYGPNGSGKTKFVGDVLESISHKIMHVYIDCIEFYSEKLIAIEIS